MDDIVDDRSTSEIARDLAKLEERVERDRVDMREEVRVGFQGVREAIAGLSFVNPDVYMADQARQDSSHTDLARRVGRIEDNRKMAVLAVVAPVVVALILVAVFGVEAL